MVGSPKQSKWPRRTREQGPLRSERRPDMDVGQVFSRWKGEGLSSQSLRNVSAPRFKRDAKPLLVWHFTRCVQFEYRPLQVTTVSAIQPSGGCACASPRRDSPGPRAGASRRNRPTRGCCRTVRRRPVDVDAETYLLRRSGEHARRTAQRRVPHGTAACHCEPLSEVTPQSRTGSRRCRARSL